MPSQSRRRRSGGSPSTDTSRVEALAPVAESRPAQPEKKGGILGWFQSAGDWVADKYDAVSETVGNAIDTTKRVAGDIVDVVKATDVGFKDGKLTVDTDLDEVMDLMPESVRERVKLGKNAENRVSLAYDTKSNSLTASSNDLEIEGMDFEGLKSGQARVQDLKITVTNPADAMAFLEGTRELLGDDSDGVKIDVSAGQADVKDLQIAGKDGGTSISSLSVSDFQGSASNADGLPFGDQARSTSASFTAGAAKLGGITSGGTTVASVDATDLSGGISERHENAYFQAGSVSASGVTDDKMTAGDLGAKDVRVDIANQGGGMVFLDDVQDHMKATVTASSATVGGMETMGASVEQANVGGLSLTADQDTSTLDLVAGSVGASNLRQGENRVGGLSGSGLDLHVGDDWSADLDRGAVTNAALLGITTKSAEVDGLSLSGAGGLSGSADRLAVSGLAGDGWSLGDATLSDLSGSRGEDGSMSGQVAALSASGAKGDGWSLGSTTMSGVSGTRGADGAISADVARLSASGAKGSGWSVGSANASGLSGGMGADGSVRATVDALNAGDASGFGASVASLEANTLAASKTGDNWDASLGSANLSGGRYGDYGVGSATVSGLDAHGRDGGISATLDSASAARLSTGPGSTIDSATLSTATVNTRDGGIDAQAEALGVRGVKVGDVTLGSGDATGASARIANGATDLSVDQVALDRLGVGDFSAKSVSASDADVHLGQDSMSASLANASLLDAGMKGVAHVDSATATNLSGSVVGDQKRTDIDALSITGASHIPSGTTVKTGELAGIHGSSSGQTSALRLDSGHAHGIASENFTAREATVGGASVNTGPRGTSGGVDSLGAKGVTFSKGPSADGGPSTFDSKALVRTASQRIDDANLSLSVPVEAGKYESGVGLEVDRDTRMNANLSVRDNRIAGLDARFANPVDGPLWTELNGMYTEDGRLKADVAGWFDQDLTKSVNEAMGLGGKNLHSLGAYGNAAANLPSSSGGSRGGKPGLQEAFDLGGMTARGNASLSAGTIDTGNAQVALGSGRGANSFSASAGNGRIDARSNQVLLDRTSANLGGMNLSTDDIRMDGAHVVVDTDGRDAGSMSGSLDAVNIEDLKFKK